MSQADRAQVVVIAISGRALAQSAAKMGHRVRVLDVFADRDTRAVGEAVCVAQDGAIALDPGRVFAALEHSAERIIVTGSGFERSPQWLTRLARYGMLCANDADIVAALKDPELAAELLRALGWEVPPTQRIPPGDAQHWLQKEIGGAGGVHVREAAGASHHHRSYYQRRAGGQPLSVTFLADGERAYMLGFNAQSFEAIGRAPYCYVGAATCAVAPALEREMHVRLDRLVRVTGLRGLNGLDFLLDAGRATVLEVNPRPTATFELYEEDIAQGLVYWHVRSFQTTVPEFAALLRARRVAPRAYRIVFAERTLRVPEGVEFAYWCRDLPSAGTSIPAGAPVLSVFAGGKTFELARAQLAQRTRDVNNMLAGWSSDARAPRAVEKTGAN